MKNLKIYLSAFALSLAGVAVHANAASENHRGDSGLCFQLIPLAGKGANRAQAENGFSRTQLGMQLERVAEDGFSRTRLGMQVGAHAANGVSSTPGAYAQATSA
ncbi:hypothetical protein [Pseudomonas sp. UBA6323]|uniref:hypothetical protein n=1 Tax=Pseudomonas sp. UBA6323 TaxID=1947329 RepID=UPI0025F1FA13|nr:hypothetical protein [Pseudomonas sp. UBA6323]